MSDARWALIAPVFSVWRARRTGPGTAARVHDLREIVNAILYVNRTGIPWEYLPHDFPPYKTVYDYYAKWEADGTTQQAHDLSRDKARRAHGRSAEPTVAVVDAQSVKTSANVAETSQGIARLRRPQRTAGRGRDRLAPHDGADPSTPRRPRRPHSSGSPSSPTSGARSIRRS
ncbi:transposase [Streptomyces olivaceoviridis]|uniref:transposase n=1 Tax=Streptomyces olivaceoviridis TaxID=1921 RepID=UPI0036C6C873